MRITRRPRSRPEKTTDRLVWGFSALSACMSAGYGVLFTVVGDFRSAYGISESMIGWIIGLGFIAGFVSQMLLAPLGDRGFARRLVVGGVLVNAAGLVMMGLGDDAVTILAGRIISGLAIGAANPAIRRVVVVVAPARLGRNLGRLMAADVFGFALGPVVSAVLVGPVGLAAPFFVIAGVSLVVVAVTLPVARVPPVAPAGERPSPRLAFDLLANPTFAGAVVLGSTGFLMIGAFDALWDVVHEDLGTVNWLANLGITLFAVPLIIFGPLGGHLAQTLGPFRVAAVGLLAAAMFMGTYGLVPTGGWIFAIAMGHAITDGLTISAGGVAVGMTAPPARQAGAQGVLGAGQALSAGVMAIVTGGVYERWGRLTAYGSAAVVMVVLVAVGMWLARDVATRRPAPVEVV